MNVTKQDIEMMSYNSQSFQQCVCGSIEDHIAETVDMYHKRCSMWCDVRMKRLEIDKKTLSQSKPHVKIVERKKDSNLQMTQVLRTQKETNTKCMQKVKQVFCRKMRK